MIHCGYGEKEEGNAEDENHRTRKAVGRAQDIRQKSASCSEEETIIESYVEGDS